MFCTTTTVPGADEMNGDTTGSKGRSMRVRRSTVAAAVSSVLAYTVAVAQEDAAPAAGQLEEIVVTAQKREQRLQDVPLSVSAISGEEMDREGARDFHDILLSIPGVSYSSTEPGQSRYSIRGVSTAAASPTVGIYLDDISLVTVTSIFSGAADPILFDLARVEVLKGPQGTLYGGNAMGGAIKYVSHSPDLDKLSVTAEGGLGSTQDGGISYSAGSVLNLPLVNDKLALRLGVSYRYDAGYIDNVPNGTVQLWSHSATPEGQPFTPLTYPSGSGYTQSNYNDRSTTLARLALKYAVDDTFTILPSVSLQRSDKANPDWFSTNMPSLESSFRFAQPTRDDLGIYNVTITKSFAGLTFTSLSGYVDRSVDFDRDYTFFVGGLIAPLRADNSYNVSNTSTHTASQEFRLASDQSAKLKWTLGAFYSQQRDDLFQSVDTVGGGAFFKTGTDITYIGDTLTRTWQEAVFGDLTYSLTDRFDVDAGLRWFDIREKIFGISNGPLNGGLTEVNGIHSSNVGVTPKLSLSYRLADDHLVYASGGKGFRQGGPNRYSVNSSLCEPDFERLGISGVPQTFQPDSIWNYELGSKNEWKDLHTVVNAAVFYTDWKKIQQQVSLTSCGFQFTGNVGAASIKGAELSIESALTAKVTVGAAGTYLGTRINETLPGVSAQVGQPILDTPKWELSAYGDYRFLQIGSWSGTFRPEYAYHGSNLRQFTYSASITYPDGTHGLIPDQTYMQDGYHVVNAILNFAHNAWEYRLYVDNLTNAMPYLDFRRSSGLSEATTLRPRTVGVSFKTTF